MRKHPMSHDTHTTLDSATPQKNAEIRDRKQAISTISSREQELLGTEHSLTWQHVRHDLHNEWKRITNEHASTDRNKADLTTPYHMSWDKAEPAIRFGYNAAYRYRHRSWSYGLGSNRLDRQLEIEWQRLHAGEPWQRVRPLVYRGWVRALINMR